ncbi:MAG: NAD(+) synthase [Bacteroidota bacterium]
MMNQEKIMNGLDIDAGKITARLETSLKDSMEKMNRDGMVLGLSGGLDSAVAAYLCRRILPGDKITALIMPEKETSKENMKDAADLAKQLNINYHIISLDAYLESASIRFPIPFLNYRLKAKLVRFFYRRMKEKTGETPYLTLLKGGKAHSFKKYLNKGTANYRFKHRLRLTFLYQAAEETNTLAVGAANKTEYMTGFFVKFGIDHNSDIMPLLGLYKTQVQKLAQYLEVPEKIINKAPTPDMIPGITDEMAFEVPYEELDKILYAIENNIPLQGELKKKEAYVKALINNSAHMRKMEVPVLSGNGGE